MMTWQVLAGMNMEDHPDLQLAQELERIALSDPYFIERKLYPNVDFYSGIVLRALGILAPMFTVILPSCRHFPPPCHVSSYHSTATLHPPCHVSGIPTSMFTVIFAIGRTPGWLAHWDESFREKNQRISRPRQLYTGEAQRPFVQIAERPEP